MNRLRASKEGPKPEPHPGAAALAISAMAVLVALVLGMVGPLRWVDRWVVGIGQGFRLPGDLTAPPMGLVWGWTVLVTFGICWAILHVAGLWRRIVLSISAVVVTLAWVPVLTLAGWQAPVAIPLISLLWGCVGSVIYAARHRELEDDLK